MPSKQVITRERNSRIVSASAETHAAVVAKQFHATYAPFVEPGESMPSAEQIEVLIKAVGRSILHAKQEMVSADEAHEDELADDGPFREARDTATEEVRLVLVDIRSMTKTGYRSAGLQAVGLSDPVPQGSHALLALGRTVLARLRDPEVTLAKPRRRSLVLPREELADELEEVVTDLGQALDDIAREAREAETTLNAKHAAIEASDRMFTRGASWLSATYAGADFTDLASRVRPSGRRPGRVSGDDEGETPAETPESPEPPESPEAEAPTA